MPIFNTALIGKKFALQPVGLYVCGGHWCIEEIYIGNDKKNMILFTCS